MSKRCLCPGSFDPVTAGHYRLIERAAALFDEVVVAVADNPQKQYAFTADERVHLCQKALAPLSNVRVVRWEGYVVDLLRQEHAVALVKGVRNRKDFAYEQKMAKQNRELEPTAETLLLCAEPGYAPISSSALKQKLAQGKAVDKWLCEPVREEIKNKLNR